MREDHVFLSPFKIRSLTNKFSSAQKSDYQLQICLYNPLLRAQKFRNRRD